MKKIITVNPEICNGNPSIKGTRITVFDLITRITDIGLGNILKNSDFISFEDIKEAVLYCQKRICDTDYSYCGGCTLRSIQDGIKTKDDFINQFSEIHFFDSEHVIKGNEGLVLTSAKDRYPALLNRLRGLDE